MGQGYPMRGSGYLRGQRIQHKILGKTESLLFSWNSGIARISLIFLGDWLVSVDPSQTWRRRRSH